MVKTMTKTLRDEDLILLTLLGLAFLRARRVEALPPRTKAKVEEVSEIAKEALKTTPEENPGIYQQLSQAVEELRQTAREENVSEITALQALTRATAEKLQAEGYRVEVRDTTITVYYEKPAPTPSPPPPPPQPPPPPRPPVADVCGKPDEVIASPPPDRLNPVNGCVGGFRKAEVYQTVEGWKASVTIFYSEIRKPPFEAVYTINLTDILNIVKPSSGKIGINVTDMFGLGELHIYVDGTEYPYGIMGYRGYVEIPIREYVTVRVEYKPKVQADQDIGVDVVVVMYP